MIFFPSQVYTFVVFGASGDLAKKKIYPTLWAIYKENLLPTNVRFVGYSRSKISVDDIRERCKPWFKVRQNGILPTYYEESFLRQLPNALKGGKITPNI